MKVGFKDLIERAERNIESISVDQAEALIGDNNTVFVDIRDIRELQREGKLPGATHAPRGMLEFWVDPDSFELFRDLRQSLWDVNFEVGWKPVRRDSPLRYCSGFGQFRSFQPQ